MARPTPADLIEMLRSPNETLTVEHKGWLDLSLNPHKAILAKAAIALANEGGGIIVMGTREDITQGGKLGSWPRPSTLSRYSQDDVNRAIARFAEPAFHCELVFAEHPDTKTEHAFVLVPGGMTVPVMSRRGSEGEIQARRCYVRKPGPKSEEPYTADEWQGVLERCLQARRETMLDAIRAIVQGSVEAEPISPTAKARLLDFISTSQDRWETLIDPLPVDDAARMPYGHYEIAFSILGVEQPLTLGELRKRIDDASSIHLTGWHPFLYLHREPFTPRPIDGMIEVWLGNPEGERNLRSSAHCNFWRAHPAGDFYQLRGYDEDSTDRVKSGSVIDHTMPIWRVGDTLLFASRLAKSFGEDSEIIVSCLYTGLKDRLLVNLQGFSLLERYECFDDSIVLETQATARQIEDNLVEVLLPLLRPLYERFSFYELKSSLISSQVERLRSGRF